MPFSFLVLILHVYDFLVKDFWSSLKVERMVHLEGWIKYDAIRDYRFVFSFFLEGCVVFLL